MRTFILCCMLGASFISAYPQGAPAKMIPDVAKDLMTWLQKIPAGQEDRYGFSSRGEFNSSHPGDPYAVYTLSEDFFTRKETANYLKPAGEWRVPVVVDNQDRALLTVIQDGEAWTIVDLGASVLARELQESRQSGKLQPPGKSSMPGSKNLKILRVYQLHSDFVFLDDASLPPGELRVIPLHSAYLNLKRLNSDSRGIWTLSEILDMIREALPSDNINH